MGKFSGYLICTDCDGTLTYEPGKVSDVNAEAIKYFQNGGGLFTLATGRFPDHAKLFEDRFKINAPMVSVNGAIIYDEKNNKLIEKWPMDKWDCYEVLSYAHSNFPKGWDYWLNGINENQEFFGFGYKPSENTPGDGSLKRAFESFNGEMLKMVIVQPEDMTPVIQKSLREKFGDRFRFDTSWPNGLEIQNINSGKGIAVQYLKEHLETNIHTTIGIGDYENDITLLECSDIGYAVSNAIESVKKVADRITVSNAENAIAKVIYDLERGM